MRFAAILLLAVLGLSGGPATAGLAEAMAAVRERDWSRAAQEARGDEIAQALVAWHRLRAGQGRFPEYLAFRRTYPDWPGLPLLLTRGEGTIPADADPSDVVAYFDGHAPRTGSGVLRLVAALEAAGRPAAAEVEAVRAWTALTLSEGTEAALLARYGSLLADHHVARMDDLLWRGQLDAAARMRPRVPEGWQLLHDARSALRRDLPGVDARIAAVPDALADDPGLAFERMEWRARRGRTEDVLELMVARSVRAESLGRPAAWGPRRRFLARDLMQDGRVAEAYLLASQNHLETGADFADLEWLAGYLALRHLEEPAAALAHFKKLRAGVATPISLGRAGYWEGRAHEALGEQARAAAAYAFAAEFQTSFYGQLAAERAGLPLDPALAGLAVAPVPRGGDGDGGLAEASVHRAGRALAGIGERALAARFFAHQAEGLDRGEVSRLLSLTNDLGDPHIQLRIAKRAAREGHVLPRGYFPLVEIAPREGVPPELALAVARRESEFNAAVISPAGALGLMQVMPATARETARALGLAYARERLLSDPAYNATLGTAYLAGLIETFGPSVVLVAAGYNAGPSRPAAWIEAYGDPRAEDVDVIDWIEAIPFRETRNYVMRVAEALAPYRAQLAGTTGPARLLDDLKGR